MDRGWAPIIFGGGLLLGFGAGFYLQDFRHDPGIVFEPAPEILPPPGETDEALCAAKARILELDAELADLKRAHTNQADALREKQQTVGKLRREIETIHRERERLRDEAARLERALAATRPDPPAPHPGKEAPPAVSPPLPTVRLLQVDASGQVIALDLGEADRLFPGTRWQLVAEGDNAVSIEITESRPGFSIARRIDPETAAALELARGKSYVIRPLP